MINKSYTNNEPFMIAIELIHESTKVKSVCMKENQKEMILDQLTKIIQRAWRK